MAPAPLDRIAPAPDARARCETTTRAPAAVVMRVAANFDTQWIAASFAADAATSRGHCPDQRITAASEPFMWHAGRRRAAAAQGVRDAATPRRRTPAFRSGATYQK